MDNLNSNNLTALSEKWNLKKHPTCGIIEAVSKRIFVILGCSDNSCFFEPTF